MAKNEYVCRFCVLLIILYANVNDSQLLTSCDNPLDNEVCELICTTPDHNKTVAFYKLSSTTTVIGQCIPTVGCGAPNEYNLTQQDLVSTVLSFVHSRERLGTWRCTYGSNGSTVSVFWASFPQTVSTTLTSNTTIETSMDVNATLECLYSDPDPTVTLQYVDANGNTVTSDETFQCVATADYCADVNFTTYDCAVVIRTETGIDHSATYSIKLKTKVGNVQTEDVQTIATGITFTHLTSSVSKPSPVSTSIANYETISTVSENITVLVEALATTSDVSLTTYKATRTLTESVNTVIYYSSFVANTEFNTTYNLSTTGVETHVPQSGFISSDLDTSMQASLLTTNSNVSMDLMSTNAAVTISDTTAASIESVSTTTGILATAFDSATSNTGSINSLIIHSFIVATPLFYATDKLSATEVETAQLQSGIISSDFVTSMAASSFAENASVSTDFMNNKTSVTVSDTNAESFEGASTTAGILATEYGATKSNTVSINGGTSLNYTVTPPLFYTTDQLSDMEVETSVLQSSFISSDLDTSIPTLNIAEESIASTDIISIETVVTVSDTTAVSFEYVATTVDILSTSFDSTLEPSHTYQSTNVPVMTSFETNDIHVDTKSYMSSSALFYLSTDIPGLFSESDYDINVTSINTYIPSTVIASADTSSLTLNSLLIMGSQATMNTTEVITLSSKMFSITSLSSSFFLQSSVVPQSTVRLQSILGPSSPELTSSTVQNIQSVSSSINIYPTTPGGNGNNGKATSQIQSALSSPELIASSVQYPQSVSSSIGTYPTTPNGNNEQTTSPIQSTFSENFITISASVAGVIIIVVGSLMVLYWLNKLPGQHQHKTNELHREKPDNISWSTFSPNNYMHNESYSGPVYQYRNIPLRLTSRYNVPYSYDHHMDYQNNWNNI